jgi:hypothetical protein
LKLVNFIIGNYVRIKGKKHLHFCAKNNILCSGGRGIEIIYKRVNITKYFSYGKARLYSVVKGTLISSYNVYCMFEYVFVENFNPWRFRG